MAIATCNGIDIYYERAGAGEQLLFISGSGADLRNQPNQFDSALADHFDLISYDQRGLGQTTNPVGEFTMQQYADDAAALLDDLNLQQVRVMGVSFGGMVAQEFAICYPDKVSRLVLACTSAGGEGGASYPLHELTTLQPEERAEKQLRVADTRRSDDWIQANPTKWGEWIEMATAGQRASRESDQKAGAIKQLEARQWHDTFERLPELNMPVLLVGGEFDGIAPPANMQAMHAKIANSELKFFTGGHMFLAQDDSSYPYIIQWLEVST